MGKTLEEIRSALDEADRHIVEALAARHSLITEVAAAKGDDSGTRDELREHEVLARVEAHARAAGLEADYVAALFHDIIQHSV
jgi:chorismate mutase